MSNVTYWLALLELLTAALWAGDALHSGPAGAAIFFGGLFLLVLGGGIAGAIKESKK